MTSPGGGETWPTATGSQNPQDYGMTTPSYPTGTTYPGTTYPGTTYPDSTYPGTIHAEDPRNTPRTAPPAAPGSGTGGGAGDMANEMAGRAQDVAGTGMEEAGRVASEAVDHVRTLVDQLRAQVDQQSREQLSRLSTSVRQFAEELDHMVESGGGDGPATTLVREASRRARALSDQLSDHTGGSLLGEIESTARRRPGMFLLGAAVAGVVAGRLAKDVQQGSHQRQQGITGGRHQATSTMPPPPVLPAQIDLTDSGTVGTTTGSIPTTPGVFDDTPGGRP